MKRPKQSVWPIIVALAALYLLAAAIDPCDGHSCQSVTYSEE